MEAIALYNFNSKENDELNFFKGANVKILNMEDDPNWFKAEFDSKIGLIPANHIDLKPHSWYVPHCSRIEAESRLLEVDDVTKQYIQPNGAFLIRQSVNAKGMFSLSVKDGREIIHFRVIYTEKNEFSIWNDVFPSINKLIDYYTTHSVCKGEKSKLVLKSCVPSQKFARQNECGYVQAQFDFKGKSIEELSFEKGEIIKKIGEEDINWWIGELKGRRGIFPSNYVQKYS